MSFDVSSDFSIQAAIDSVNDRKKSDQELGRTDFLKMLVAQLAHQDPLNPQDSSEFSAQLAQFSSLEQLISMKAGIDKLVEAQTSGSANLRANDLLAANLLGREVAVFNDELTVPAPGGAVEIQFFLGGNASDVDIEVYDENNTLLYTIQASASSEQATETETVTGTTWSAGLNSFEWHRPKEGEPNFARSPSEVRFKVVAKLAENSVEAQGVTVGIVASSSLGFNDTVLTLRDGRSVSLESVLEVRGEAGAG